MMLEKLDGGNKPCAKVLPRKKTLDLMIPPPPTPEDEKGGDQTKEGADEADEPDQGENAEEEEVEDDPEEIC